MNRTEMIQYIMDNKYYDDDPKNDGSNLAFLQSLETKELEKMVDDLEIFEMLGQ